MKPEYEKKNPKWKPIDEVETSQDEATVNEKFEDGDDEFIPSSNRKDWVAVNRI